MSKKAEVGPWGAVPTALLQEPGVTLNRLRVYASLASYQGRDETCWPSVAMIAERAGVPRGAVSECTRWLEETGWISKQRRANQRQTTVYIVLMEIIENPEVRESRKSGSPGIRAKSGSPGKPSYNKNNNENNNAPAKPSPHQKIIDEYYKLHKENTGDSPTINGKQAKAVKRMLQSHDERNILAKLKHYYSIDEWYTKGGRDINMFESHYDKIPLPEGAARKKPRQVCSSCGRPRVGTEGSCMYCLDGQFVEATA